MSNPNCDRLEEILRRTGLGSLRGKFEDEGIDDGVLGRLTEGDLQQLGIEKMGDRKRIMVAIKETVIWVKPVEVFSSYLGPEMVKVQGGVLPGGSEVKEKRVGRFWVGKYAVTWGEWKEVREWAVKEGYELEEGRGAGERYPVTDVSWYSAVKWCNARSEKEGLGMVYDVEGGWFKSAEVYRRGAEDKIEMKGGVNGYRLPSDGEWEWAARGGVDGQGYEYSGSNHLEKVGWYMENSGGKTHEVGTKIGNELGIDDLSGNVWEWCFDQWVSTGADRVGRGGSWDDGAYYARVSYRYISNPSYGDSGFGFRVARSSVP